MLLTPRHHADADDIAVITPFSYAILLNFDAIIDDAALPPCLRQMPMIR